MNSVGKHASERLRGGNLQRMFVALLGAGIMNDK